VWKEDVRKWSETNNRPINEWTRLPDLCVGGAKSEGQWRAEFGAHGWPISEPDQKEVEVGIARCYAAFREDKLFVTKDCPFLLDDIRNYSREVDDEGNPISDTIQDKDAFHSVDSMRYIVSYLRSVVPEPMVMWA
jgi:hypothetical protein